MDSRSDEPNVDVLCVDDDSALRDLSKAFLEREDDGLTVHTAASASEALDRLDETEFDAVVSDYRMPELNGLEFLEAVRRDHGDDIPFLMFTGQGREEVAMDALNLGADRYLQKGGDSKSQYGVLARAIRQEVAHHQTENARHENEKRYRSLFENSPLVFWVEDFSAVKSHLDEVTSDVEDVESYFEEHPEVVQTYFDKLEVIDVNENALDYYGAESKRELLDNMEKLFTEESYEANKSLAVQMANGKTHLRTESMVKTLDGERKHEILEVNVPEEYADDYSRVYVTALEVTDRVEAQDREAFLHSLLRHDVRNKAQVVRGNLERLDECTLSDEAAECVQNALDALDESTSIIGKVDALVRAEADAKPTEEVALRPVVESVVDRFEARATQLGVALELRGDDLAVAAGPLLEELLTNLVGNVLRHADASTVRITIRDGEDADDGAVVAVDDDGVGVPDDERDRIFERRYKRGESSGAGLGLYLVGRIAETYGGRVEVTDSDLGGARFEVYLG